MTNSELIDNMGRPSPELPWDPLEDPLGAARNRYRNKTPQCSAEIYIHAVARRRAYRQWVAAVEAQRTQQRGERDGSLLVTVGAEQQREDETEVCGGHTGVHTPHQPRDVAVVNDPAASRTASLSQ